MTATADNMDDKERAAAEALLQELKRMSDLRPAHIEACDTATLLRYLRARHFNVHKAAKLLHSTLKWRDEFKVDTLNIGEFSNRDLSSGRMYVAGNDPSGKSILVTRKRSDAFQPGEYNAYLRYLVFSLETAARAMKNGQEKWVWIMDMRGYSRANSPPLSVSMATLHILADHFPERLHRCFFIDAPGVFHFLFNAVWPFIDSVTRQKIVFINTRDFAAQIDAVVAAGEDESAREKALEAAAVQDDPDAFSNYLRWYCAPYDQKAYISLLESVGWKH